MSDDASGNDPDLLRAKLNLETARIAWGELQHLHASGNVIAVAPSLDLVTVAAAFAEDDRGRVEAWLVAGDVHPVGDDEARRWHDADTSLWAVVVRPFVLVQERADAGPACAPLK